MAAKVHGEGVVMKAQTNPYLAAERMAAGARRSVETGLRLMVVALLGAGALAALTGASVFQAL